MKFLERSQIRDLLLLSLTAGSADAAGFIGLGHVFTCNMTGNVVLLGIDLGEGHLVPAGQSSLSLVSFLVGALLGALLARGIPDRDWRLMILRLMGFEVVALLAFAFLWQWLHHGASTSAPWLVSLLALAMGLQSIALYRLQVPGVATTAITGTLITLLGSTAQLLPGGSEKPAKKDLETRETLFLAVLVILYFAGAAASALILRRHPGGVGFLPAGLVLLVVLCRLPKPR